MTFSKQDIEYHSVGLGRSVPMVNVKHNPDFRRDFKWSDAEFGHDPSFTIETLDTLFEADNDLYGIAWEIACESCWDQLQNDAEEIFGRGTKVYSEGRSGGWAYINGITADDVDAWDAIELAKWAKFSKWAKLTATDVAYQMAWFVYYNVINQDQDQMTIFEQIGS